MVTGVSDVMLGPAVGTLLNSNTALVCYIYGVATQEHITLLDVDMIEQQNQGQYHLIWSVYMGLR